MLDLIGSVLGSVASLTGVNGPRDDDFVDRLNHVISVSIFSLFAVFVSTKQFAGAPINCWLSKNYEDSHKSYITSYCWIQNTYRVSFTETIPESEKQREMANVKYYQWVPVILMFQILLFKLPNLVWKCLKDWSGIDINKIGAMAEKTQMEDMVSRETSIKNIATCISRWLTYKREYHNSVYARMRDKFSRFTIIFFFLGIRNGTYLIGLYLFIKFLYFVNVIVQFYLLNVFLGENFSTYGFDVMQYLYEDGHIEASDWFPKVTFCDFKIRQLNNIQTFTTQCVLSINLFTEKIFIFIWFWLLILAFVNCYSCCRWLYKVFFRKNGVKYVERYLTNVDPSRHHEEIDQFVNVYLRDDGVFLLRVVANNSGTLPMFDLINELWVQFQASDFTKVK